MEFSPIQITGIRLSAFSEVLKKVPDKAKHEHITIALADEYNSIREKLAEALPALKDHFPKPITSTGDYRIVGVADNSYIDLEIYVAQLHGLIGLHNSDQ